jgi:hypothetical protein
MVISEPDELQLPTDGNSFQKNNTVNNLSTMNRVNTKGKSSIPNVNFNFECKSIFYDFKMGGG